MPRVKLITDPFDQSTYSEHEVASVVPFLREQFPTWPETARIYKGEVSQENDVTPTCEADLAALEDGDLYYVIIYPGDPVTMLIVAVAVFVVATIALLMFMPRMPGQNGDQGSSSINSLGNRVNKARPNGRIPDIFGKVRAIPELLTYPLLMFQENLEFEICFMCVGRGEYLIDPDLVYDGQTPLDLIAGASARFYGPGTHPGNGAPSVQIGSPINYPLKNVLRINEINGQRLLPPNAHQLAGRGNIRLSGPASIVARPGSGIDFTTDFGPGSNLTLTNGTVDGQTYNGTFPIIEVTPWEIVLGDPGDVNPAWDLLGAGETAYFSPSISSDGTFWIGPFIIDMADCNEVVANFICPQGLYRIDEDGDPRTQSVSGVLEVTPVDLAGLPVGGATLHPVRLSNSPTGENDGIKHNTMISKSPIGVTLRAPLNVAGRVQVRFRRTTPLPTYKDDQFVDELAIRDCYGLGPITQTDFGNITTVHTKVQATSAASAPKERKLACVVIRKVLEHHPDHTFGPALVPSQNAADIICHMALDPYIGGRVLHEIDVPQIYDAVGQVEAYFGFDAAAQFNYAFDEDNISFEEMVQGVANAVFCTAYRQGSMLRLFFERETSDSTLLFNHRNKLPGSETRTVRFGYADSNDGVEFDWRNEDGETATIFLPADQTATRPKKIERIGITDARQAQIHADRIWNRVRYQNTTVEFDATGEASQLTLNERIEVADNTRADIVDGYIVSQDGLVVELSQPFNPIPGPDYMMFVQLPTGEVEVIPVVGGEDQFHAILSRPPSVALAIDASNWADVTYQITTTADPRSTAFLLTEKGAYDKKSVRVQAINYDPRYYQNDHDHS